MKTSQDNLASVLDLMTDRYIENLRQGTSTQKPKVTGLVKAYKPTKRDMKELVDQYASLVDEIESALDGDEDLREAWDFLSKTKLNHLISFATLVRDFLETNSKITRRKRAKSASVQVKKMKFKEECDGVKSINPEEIIGSKILVCYNCKQNKMFWYESDTGFEVKGTTIQNFDPDKSYGKNFGRSKMSLQDIAITGVRAIKQEIDKLKNKNLEVTGRVSSDVVLIKVSNSK